MTTCKKNSLKEALKQEEIQYEKEFSKIKKVINNVEKRFQEIKTYKA